VPALGALLADPLCSLVDTAAVGRAEYASSAGLAALGPNTAIFGGLNMVFSFLTTATTASVARLAGRPRETAAYVCAALRVAVGLGVLCAAALHAGALPLLAAFNVPLELAPLAAEYLKIRASCLPALLVATVCVATCLGKKDPKSPLVAAALATAVNVALDAALVLGPPKLGVRGAAAATAAAQFCAAWALVRRVVFADDEVGAETRERIFTAFSLEGAGTPSGGNRRSRRGFEAYAPLLMAWPVALRSVVLMAAVAGVTASAARLGVVPAAAHQIMLSVLTVAQFFPEPVSQAAQAFLAKGAPGVRDGEDAMHSTEGEVSKGDGASDEESDGDVERDFSAESVGDDGSRDFVDSSTRTLTRAAALCSLITAAFAAVPALMPEAFTADAAVAAAVRGADLQLVATCALLPWVCVTDGLLLARREYALCTAVLCVAASVTFAYLGAGPFGALNGPPLTLAETWAGFLLLQAARLAQNAGRLWWIRRARAKGFGRGNKGVAYVKL
jgi:Na+-driven multidrug efflux pump